jgi:thymidine kinase
MAIADDVTKLQAVCVYCGEPAYVSHRLSQEKEQVVIGAKDKYEAVCRKCYLKSTEHGKY